MKIAALTVSMLSIVFIGLAYAVPYFVEVLDVSCRGEARVPIGYCLVVTITVRNNAPLHVGVDGTLILHCTLMDGSQETYSYPFDHVTVKPYTTETLKTTVSFEFTTPENPKAIYSYTADVVVVVEGLISSRTIEVKSVHTMGSRLKPQKPDSPIVRLLPLNGLLSEKPPRRGDNRM